jgi:hypothetical protein
MSTISSVTVGGAADVICTGNKYLVHDYTCRVQDGDTVFVAQM